MKLQLDEADEIKKRLHEEISSNKIQIIDTTTLITDKVKKKDDLKKRITAKENNITALTKEKVHINVKK